MIVRGVSLVVLATLALAACGSGSAHQPAPSQQAALAGGGGFPAAHGRTIAAIRRGAGEGPAIAPTVSDLRPGPNRFGFGLLDANHKAIRGASVALYVERSGTSDVRGPFLARELSLSVAPRYRSQTVGQDPDAAPSIYVATVDFPGPGTYAVQALARVGGRLLAATVVPSAVTAHDRVPALGQKAPRVSTPTLASANGDASKIDTRVPPDTMHAADLASVLGRQPVVLLFATPSLCQSRVCGPVTDIAEEVHAERGRGVAFIHNEIYLDNQIRPGCLGGSRPVAECVRPQVLAYRLPTEPWLFAIDRHGTIVARIEGAFAKPELEAALRAATGAR